MSKNKMAFQKFGVMFDCSRNAVMNFNTFKKMVDILSSLGYNTIRMYTEDTYEVDEEPYFGYMRGRYSKEELKEMDQYAASKNIELIPCIQTLAHLGGIFRYAEYEKIRDTGDILLVGEERTYVLIEHMFHTISECFSTKHIHIGMDEAFLLGRGIYQDKNGEKAKATIMKEHLDRVLAIADKYGFSCEIWGDMFMRSAYGDIYEHTLDDSESVAKLVPEKLKICYWDYYSTETAHYEEFIDKHRRLSEHVSFAGAAWTWTGYCPNNRYSLKITEAALRACQNKGVEEVYLTMWGDHGGECSYFGALPTLVAASEFAKGNFDMQSIREIFQEKLGMSYDLFSALELPDTVYDKPEEEPDCAVPSTTMLFTDPFCGIFDLRVREGVASEYYGKLSQLLKVGEKDKEWGYIFTSIRTLCDVLEIKFDLGFRTRQAYEAKNLPALKKLAEEDYTEIIRRLEIFYDTFEICWMTEKKALGFEVQDIRLGGLIKRLEHCKRRIEKYVSGHLESIPELEEKLLQPLGTKGEKIGFNDWSTLVSANVL